MYAESVTVTSDFYASVGRPSPAPGTCLHSLGTPVSQSWGGSNKPSVILNGWASSCSSPGPPSILSASPQSSACALLCRGEGQPLCHSPPPGSVFPRPLVCSSLRVPDSVISAHRPTGSPYLTLQGASFSQVVKCHIPEVLVLKTFTKVLVEAELSSQGEVHTHTFAPVWKAFPFEFSEVT